MSTSNVITGQVEISGSRKNLKRDQELDNPCWKEHNLSLQCLEQKFYDYDKCHLHFENYRNCKKFWAFIVSARKRSDKRPYLPPPEEREKIRTEYFNAQKR